jgi:hypothetical protein
VLLVLVCVVGAGWLSCCSPVVVSCCVRGMIAWFGRQCRVCVFVLCGLCGRPTGIALRCWYMNVIVFKNSGQIVTFHPG